MSATDDLKSAVKDMQAAVNDTINLIHSEADQIAQAVANAAGGEVDQAAVNDSVQAIRNATSQLRSTMNSVTTASSALPAQGGSGNAGSLAGAQTGIAQQGGLGAPTDTPNAIAQGRGPVSAPVPAPDNTVAGANQPEQAPVNLPPPSEPAPNVPDTSAAPVATGAPVAAPAAPAVAPPAAPTPADQAASGSSNQGAGAS